MVVRLLKDQPQQRLVMCKCSLIHTHTFTDMQEITYSAVHTEIRNMLYDIFERHLDGINHNVLRHLSDISSLQAYDTLLFYIIRGY